MKRLPTYIAVAVLVLVLGTYMCTFQVRSTEVAILKLFGAPSGEPIATAGLKWKLPWPIHSVVTYDSRKRVLEDKTEETSTRDGKNVILTTYTIWRISDPRKFHENFQVEENGVKELRSSIQTMKNAEVGQRDFSEFVSVSEGATAPPAPGSGPEPGAPESSLRTIERSILARIQAVDQDYGLEVVEFGIKKLGLPQSVTSAIFGSMKSAQESKAGIYTTAGEAQARDIHAKAEAAKERILSVVTAKVSRIEAEGQKKVNEYYTLFNEHPELRIFLDNIRALKKALATRTTLIFDTNGLPFSVMVPEGREAAMRGDAAPVLPTPRDVDGGAGTSAEQAPGESGAGSRG